MTTTWKKYRGFFVHPEIGESIARLANYFQSRTGVEVSDSKILEMMMPRLQSEGRVMLYSGPGNNPPDWVDDMEVEATYSSKVVWIRGPKASSRFFYKDGVEIEDDDQDEDEHEIGEDGTWLDDFILKLAREMDVRLGGKRDR